MSSTKSRMNEKLLRIVSGNYSPKDFIIADAKMEIWEAGQKPSVLRRDR